MRQDACEVCCYQSELGAIEKHHVVPKEVTEKAGFPESEVKILCCNCHREVETWYRRAKITRVVYNSDTKRFQPKPWTELVKEYEAAYDDFVRYKKERLKIDFNG